MKLLPKEPSNEMVQAWCANCHAWDLDAYKAMYQAAPEVEQIPVNLIAGANIVWMDDDVIEAAEFKGWLMRMPKLYTHPQPKREPLSAEQLVLLWNGSTKEIPYEHFQAVFRFAEKSHGIGVE